MAIKYSKIDVELREIIFSAKPASMLSASPKGTVPVLILSDKSVIDESRDIIYWALAKNDPDSWLPGNNTDALVTCNQLLDENDFSFKTSLDKYKYSDRFPEHSVEDYRAMGEVFLEKLEQRLEKTAYLLGDQVSVADIAIFPFVRQFASVDKPWFSQTSYRKVQTWLDTFLQSDLFHNVMHKYERWEEGMPPIQL